MLSSVQASKMAASAHAFMRGSTTRFYEWLETTPSIELPQGPPVWICGDCHVGNLGPIANADGEIEIQIRDLDQTVIGNPVHDILRLGLSLATAARGSDLPGLVTVRLIENLMEGYRSAFLPPSEQGIKIPLPAPIKVVMKRSAARSWKELAEDRLENADPTIPLGRRFWPIAKDEKKSIESLFQIKAISSLATRLKRRNDDEDVDVIDSAYWLKGCSSLGFLRYAVLLDVGRASRKGQDYCLVDIKEATKSVAHRNKDYELPKDDAERVLMGAKNLSPYLGERMVATQLMGKSVFIRELLPQDLKIELDQLSPETAMNVARFLANVVGEAHARQMDAETKRAWLKELNKGRSKTLEAPSWLWNSLVALMGLHEQAYLEHCRKYSTAL